MLLKQYTSDNDTLVVGKIRVAGKRDLGQGAQEGGPSWGEDRSGGTGGSHPGLNVPDLPPGVRPISHSPEGLWEPGGGAPPGGSTDQVVPGVATLEWIFLRTCLQWARGLLWGKVQPKGALPCHRPLISNDNTIKVNNIGQKSE